MTSRLPTLFPRDRMPIKRMLRLKRLANARSLLPIPRKRLKSHLKFRLARKPVRAVPLKNGIKWLSLLTPCQRSCNCLGFQTKTVAWKLRMVHSKSIYDLKAEDLCQRCKHPLWEHRRKWRPQDRRDRYAVVRDIRLLQNLILKEKNLEKFRIYFMLWKDLIATIVENTPVPKKLYCSTRVLESDSSIRNALQLYMQSKDAKRLGFINKHALDLLKTLDSFDYPPPNKTTLFSMFFLSSRFKNSKAERQFQQWYRQWYEMYVVHCNLPQFLLSLPQFCVVDIMTYHFLAFIDQYVSLKLEEQYAATGDPEIKIIAVLFKKLVEFCKSLKLICPKQARKLPLRNGGENVLSEAFISETEVHNMGMRHVTSMNAILNEESGPDYFKKLPPPEPNMTLQVDDPIRFCQLVWKAQRRKQLGQFLDKAHPKPENVYFLRDPNTLADFNDLSNAMEKKKRRRYFASNCDRERDEGKIVMVLLRNHRNAADVHRNDFLIQFVTVIHRQLPKMPKHYILKLVMDRHHRSLILLKYIKRGSSPGWTVLGGICFRPFVKQGFSEIVFVAVHADHQVRGYGGYLMDHLKRIHVEQLGFPHLLTFADKNAIGYFRKQGFSKESEVPKTVYGRFIKEYDSATLMYCHSRICNNKDDIVYWAKKMGKIFRNIHKINCPEWYGVKKGLTDKFLNFDLIPMNLDRKEKIDQVGLGLNEADIGLPKLFWQDQYEKMWRLPHFENVQSEDEQLGFLSEDEDKVTVYEDKNWFRTTDRNRKEWNSNLEDEMTKMYMMLETLYRCPFSWPFHFPVDEYDAPTYHDEIARPMTLEIVEDRLHWGYYVSVSFEKFTIV
uniref:Histone acetyltransferase n=1 Tax=Panagrolaimus sp. JU765 TaxID=591449 RepID=A0AC34Q0C7_9BILA